MHCNSLSLSQLSLSIVREREREEILIICIYMGTDVLPIGRCFFPAESRAVVLTAIDLQVTSFTNAMHACMVSSNGVLPRAGEKERNIQIREDITHQ
jgi:hypothetical protein